MSITAILEEEEERCPEGVLRRCLGCSLISFPYCSFEEEGNETNQRKKNRSFSSQTTTFSCFSNIVCVSMSEVGSGPQVGWLWWRIMVSARARGWGLFFFSSESRWPWRGSGVRGRRTRKAHMRPSHAVAHAASVLARRVGACMQTAVQRFERRLRAAWEAGVSCYTCCASLVDRVTCMCVDARDGDDGAAKVDRSKHNYSPVVAEAGKAKEKKSSCDTTTRSALA